MKYLSVFIIVLLADMTGIMAAPTVPAKEISPVYELPLLVDGATDGSTDDDRTAIADCKGYVKVLQDITIVKGTGTAVVATCYGSNDGVTYAQLTTTAFTLGAGTVYPRVYTIPFSASGTYKLEIDVWGNRKFKCVYSITGGTTDAITVGWNLTARK